MRAASFHSLLRSLDSDRAARPAISGAGPRPRSRRFESGAADCRGAGPLQPVPAALPSILGAMNQHLGMPKCHIYNHVGRAQAPYCSSDTRSLPFYVVWGLILPIG